MTTLCETALRDEGQSEIQNAIRIALPEWAIRLDGEQSRAQLVRSALGTAPASDLLLLQMRKPRGTPHTIDNDVATK